MAPSLKKTSAAASGAGKNTPGGKRQRTSTNKQQQLGRHLLNSWAQLICGLLDAQRIEKEESAKKRVLTDAIQSEQRQEELSGFHKRKSTGNVYPLPVILTTNLLLITPGRQ